MPRRRPPGCRHSGAQYDSYDTSESRVSASSDSGPRSLGSSVQQHDASAQYACPGSGVQIR
jgi:hypothetical protein